MGRKRIHAIDKPRPTRDPDAVVLRVWPDAPHNPIAIFPNQPEGHFYGEAVFNSYQHIGQHGASAREPSGTVKANAYSDACKALLTELRSIGYKPVVIRRWPSPVDEREDA